MFNAGDIRKSAGEKILYRIQHNRCLYNEELMVSLLYIPEPKSMKKPHTYKEESMVYAVSFVLHSRFIVFTFDSLYNKDAIILR